MRTKTFKTRSGETLTLIPVNQVELAPLAQKILPLMPNPPMQTVQTASGPKEVAHETHPDYLEAKQAFEIKHGVYMSAVMFELGVDIEFTPEQQNQIDRRRRKLEKLFPDALENQFDTYVYLKMVCEDDELTQLMSTISSINNPTAQQVQSALDTFRPGVQGPSDYENKDAPKWTSVPDWQPEVDTLPGGQVGGIQNPLFLRETAPRVAG